MKQADLVKLELENLRVKGGRVGGWKVAPNGPKAHGGLGIIFFGTKRDMRGIEQESAIKFQLPKSLPDGTRFSLEASLSQERFAHEHDVLVHLQDLKSPYIVRPLDNGIYEIKVTNQLDIDVSYFAQERMQGPDLEKIVENKPLRGQAWLELAFDLFHGADDFHKKGVIHLDIKPSNVMRHLENYVYVDFGLASFINRPDPGDNPGYSLGYSSPEQLLANARQIDGSSLGGHADMFSIGATLFHSATGVHPWETEMKKVTPRPATRAEVLQTYFNVIHQSKPDYSLLSKQQMRIVEPLLDPNFRNRPTAEEMLRLVTRLLDASSPRKAKGRELQPAAIRNSPKKNYQPQRIPPEVSQFAREKKPFTSASWLKVTAIPLFLGSVTSWFIPVALAAYIYNGKTFQELSRDARANYIHKVTISLVPILGWPFQFSAARKTDSKLLRALFISPAIVQLGILSFANFLNLNQSTRTAWIGISIAIASVAFTFSAMKEVGNHRFNTFERIFTFASKSSRNEGRIKGPAGTKQADANRHFEKSWNDLGVEIYARLSKVKRKRFLLDFENDVVNGIFIQGLVEKDGSVTIEAAANLSLRPELSDSQISRLLSLGWLPPSRDIPNFIKFLDREESSVDHLTQIIIETLKDGYGISAKNTNLI